MLKLKNLIITSGDYGINKGKLIGSIKVEGEYTETTFKLTEDQTYKIIELVAEQVIVSAQQTASILMEALQRPQAQIEE